MENYYDILGVSKEASDDEIKKAYRKLAHKHHPDKSGGDEKKFKEINAAYQVLSDKSKRQQYDQYGRTFDSGSFSGGGNSQGGFDFGGFDFSDFSKQGGFNFEFGSDFEDIFSNIFGGERTARRRKRGQDIQVDVEISFEEMVKGTHKIIKLRKNIRCDRCQGSGGEPGASKKKCPNCKGSGRVERVSRGFFGSFSQVSVCNECHGEGILFEKNCSKCGGDGRVKTEEKIEISIPAGVSDGQTVSVQGAGEAGEKGLEAGDLFVVIHVRPDQKFIRKGQDISSKEYISFSLAALGGEKEIDTIDGKLILNIPSGTQSGEIFRIKNKGVYDNRGRERGNHFVTLVVKVPKKLSREQKELVEKLGNLE
jgi:molecular chaperone DnaJ